MQSSESLNGVHLRADEKLVSVTEYVPPERNRPMSSLLAMSALTGVSSSREIGMNGPSNASNTVKTASENEPGHQGKYDVFFVRDAHVVAGFLAELYPALARSTVITTMESMGTRDNYITPVHPFDEQEIGKPAHEVRESSDPIARDLTESKDWGWPYYGAVDTASKNIITIGKILESDQDTSFLREEYKDRDGKVQTVGHGLELNARWLRERMDKNPEGLVESVWKNPKHHPNQTWADSTEAFYHADGSWAEHHPEKEYGRSAVEQQAEAYDALLIAAHVFELQGDLDKAGDMRQRAARLQRVVLDVFWVEDQTKFGGYFAQGTDRDSEGRLRPLAVRSSDMGNVLNSNLLMPTGDQVLDEELSTKRDAIIQNLFSSDMLGLSGIRTKSKDSARYDDDRYHGGDSWPWVSAYIADGLDKHGYFGLANELKKRVLETANATKMLGEFVSGSDDPTKRIITQAVTVESSTNPFEKVYAVSQPAQEVQAWTAAAVLKIKCNNNPFKHTAAAPQFAQDEEKRLLETEILKRRFSDNLPTIAF